MPLYDVICVNKHEGIDVYRKIDAPFPPCEACGEPTERLWKSTANVIGDDIPGGIVMEHGICHDDGSPRTYYSKSEMAKVAKEKGLINKVRHIGSDKGSDKNKHTQRWV